MSTQEISLDALADQLGRLSRDRLMEIQAEVMDAARKRLESQARTNIGERLEERSRKLIMSLRSELRVEGDSILAEAKAGGSYGGVDVPYARLQELGGYIFPVQAKLLAIPVEKGLTGPGIPRYDSPRQMPFAEFRLAKRGKVKWLVVDARNDELYFILVTDTQVPGKRYMGDALDTVYATLAQELADAAAAGVVGEA